MKNILKKLHIVSPKESDDSKGRTLSRGGSKSCDGSPSDSLSPARSYHGSSDNKPFSALSSWLNSVAHKHISTSPPGSSSNAATGESKLNPSPPTSLDVAGAEKTETSDTATSGCLDEALDAVRRDSGSSNSRDPDIEEEYQIQLALELSAREDPEAVQIEAVKQISLGSCPPENTPAEVIAFRYWKYNALSYDDKILDGFYDLCGVMGESTSERMPPLVDLQGTPLSDNINWEAILVNRAADANLIKLDQKALAMASTSQSDSQIVSRDLLQRLAAFVADYMGGPVGDPDNISRAWRSLSYSLKATLGSMVLPLGSLTIGLARHRALLFKVLADSLGIPCRLVKGQQHTGFDNVAMNIVKIDNGREYIVDLMADPGTLIPSDAAGAQIDYEGSLFSASHLSRDIDSSHAASFGSEFTSSFDENLDGGTLNMGSKFRNLGATNESADQGESAGCIILSNPVKPDEESKATSGDLKSGFDVKKTVVGEFPMRSTQPHMHAKSPSWTEGVSSPAGRKMKVKDVSQYMIDAAKENPQLAQKLHDVLLESGVVAPANLFTGIYSEQSNVSTIAAMPPTKDNDDNEGSKGTKNNVGNDDLAATCVFSPLPHHGVKPQVNPSFVQPDQPKTGEGLQTSLPCELRDMDTQPIVKNVPVAAAAAAAAAVVASSMVVAAAKSNTDSNIEFPVAAAATATAAAVAATTAAVGKKYSHLETSAQLLMGAAARFNQMDCMRNGRDVDGAGFEAQNSIVHGHDCLGANPEAERISDKSTSNDSTKSDIALDDVAECEIVWEDITVGERIGLGSYGEVYHGELHGTEVAVKKFLDQDISGEALVEFKSEVRIMKRLRHPNVVLFMGAVTRAPNLSIVTEFLPRGSLYRLIHRPNNQLDERRRLRMALDAARGMNYLHNCSPVIVHRDLKSPNLLVDKNWVVKVCDFGLSKMKHSTFLSSRSTAGTAEWMAPEVLRNEPSDEKCDVFSFGVILWELSTLQQPWGGMNPMQVVGAVGFQHRRLDIPHDMDPAIADIIQKCWHTDPKMRPKFSDIMDALKPLQKPITGSYAQRSGAGITQKGRTSQATEDP